MKASLVLLVDCHCLSLHFIALNLPWLSIDLTFILRDTGKRSIAVVNMN